MSATFASSDPEKSSAPDRVLDWVFARLRARSERTQLLIVVLISAVGLIAGWKLTMLRGAASVWGLAILVATFVAVGNLMAMIAASIFLQSPRWRLLDLQRDLADLIRMPGLQFEQFVAELLEARGFIVERRGGSRPDGGVDMIATKNSRSYIVQCKQWRQYISRPLLQQLYGVVVSNGADGGLFITTGLFSERAKEFVDALNSPKIRLVDGTDLSAALQEMQAVARLEA